MRSKIQTVLSKTQFFKIINTTNNSTTYILEKTSQILIRNIYINWLWYLHLKTHKLMPIYVQKPAQNLQNKISPPLGIICHNDLEFVNRNFKYYFDDPSKTEDVLQLKLIIPQQDFMQYFVQWQRYRKYWWSSITTTPSLFAIGDIKQGDNEAEADIVAKFTCENQTVEQIKIVGNYNAFNNSACLTCSMSLNKALLILLLEGINNNPRDKYLRLHRKIAPYKMSFALHSEDQKIKQTLKDLASLLFHRLRLEKVSVCLPDFSISLNEQIYTNIEMGIPYTTILDESTLDNGILYLLNSSTMLKEQLHVADFHSYAASICSAR